MSEDGWEYGFYDTASPSYVWWYAFGGLIGFDSPESARRTASKCVTDEAVIVRRHPGESAWERVE